MLSIGSTLPHRTKRLSFKNRQDPRDRKKTQLNPIVPMPNGNDPYASIPIKEGFKLGKICTFNLNNTELPQSHPPITKEIQSEKKVH